MKDIFKEFHYLIEIAAKIDYWKEKDDTHRTKQTQHNLKFWFSALRKWMEESYQQDGFKESYDVWKKERQKDQLLFHRRYVKNIPEKQMKKNRDKFKKNY